MSPSPSPHSSSKSQRRPDLRETALLAVVDGALAACICVVPLLMGGRHPLGRCLLLAAAVVAALAWLFRQAVRGEFRWRRSPADWLLPAGLALLLLQLAPLGAGLLALLSPHTPHVLPLWTSSSPLGLWTCISMTPPVTREAVLLFLAYSLVVLVAVQRLKYLEDIERLLYAIALAAVGMAILGLLQRAEGNGLYLWFYQHPYSDASESVKGSFSNRNHFAQFLALGLGPLLAWLLAASLTRRKHHGSGRRRNEAFDPAAIRLVALGVVILAGLMSLSRGGAAALAVAGCVGVTAGCRAGAIGRRTAIGVAAVALLTVAVLAVQGIGAFRTPLADPSAAQANLDAGFGRRAIWIADVKAVPHYLAVGTGVGSHAEVYPMYLEISPRREYTHAENSPLELLLETGAVGLGLMLAAVALVAFWCLGALRAAAARQTALGEGTVPIFVSPRAASARKWDCPPRLTQESGQPLGEAPESRESRRLLLCAGAVSASLAANVVQALVDFVWYVPGCMVLMALQAAAAYRLWQLARDPSGRRFRTVAMPRAAALAAILLLLVGGAWAMIHSVGLVMAQAHWDAYVRMDMAAAQQDGKGGQAPFVRSTRRAVPANGASPLFPSPADDQATQAAVVRRIAELEEVLQWNSDLAPAHVRLADAYLTYFDLHQMSSANAMPLAQLRAAAAAAGFPSAEALSQWLTRAVGDRRADLERARRHALAAVALSPLEGEAYLILAELCFLDGPNSAAAEDAYVAQALAVRPYDGAILLAAGKHSAAAGNLPLALEYWQKAFHCSLAHRTELLDLVAGRIPVEFLLAAFHPDLDSLRALHDRYTHWAEPAEAQTLRQLYRQSTQARPGQRGEATAARQWLDNQLIELRRCYSDSAEQEAAGLRGATAAAVWLEASSLRGQIGDRPGELQDAQNAAQAEPANFTARFEVARCLVAAGRYAEARPFLDWCLERRPNDARLRVMLGQTTRNAPATARTASGTLR